MNRFLVKTPENSDLNQYWYSADTIAAVVDEVKACGGRVAFVSTPSLYFSLDADTRSRCALFDYDRQWETDPSFHWYDFNAPEGVPAAVVHTFDLVVIDPPFITREVWEKYTVTARLLGVPDGARFLCSTIAENAPMMAELLGVVPQAFKPSIPKLVYQYNWYANFACSRLNVPNPEIPED